MRKRADEKNFPRGPIPDKTAAPGATIDNAGAPPPPQQGFDWGGLVSRAGKWIVENPQISSPLIGMAIGGLGSWAAGRNPLAGAAMGGIAGYGFGQLGGFGGAPKAPATPAQPPQANMQGNTGKAAPVKIKPYGEDQTTT